MATTPSSAPPGSHHAPVDIRWMGLFALAGLVASGTSTWVHHQVLTDPAYASFCDVTRR